MACRIVSTLLGIALLSSSAVAEGDPYQVTPVEQAACLGDATTYCAYTFPDEALLLKCMRSNMTRLSAVCHSTFVAGLKRRHLL